MISYHNHTNWSDGYSTISELVASAYNAGVTELGISDHLAITPDGRFPSWSIQAENLDAYVEDVLRAAQNTDVLTIRLGAEVDFFPETLEESINLLKPYPFDFIIGSVHFINEFTIDLNSCYWEKISQEEINQIWQTYWYYIATVAQSGYFDFIGHFDLPKKFKFYPDIDLTAEALGVLDVISAADMAIEINTSGWHKPVREVYPSLFYLKEARRRNIPILINSDSHFPNHVTRDFKRAHKLASSAGYTETVRYEKRKRSSCPF